MLPWLRITPLWFEGNAKDTDFICADWRGKPMADTLKLDLGKRKSLLP